MKKIWKAVAVKLHVRPPPSPLIKIKIDQKTVRYLVEIKLHRNPMSLKLDMYEFKMVLFDNGDPEEFSLLLQTYEMIF